MTSGVTIYAHNYASLLRRPATGVDGAGRPAYYREADGHHQRASVRQLNYLYEKTNGKVDASFGDAPTQLMVGIAHVLNRGRSASW